MTYQYTVFTPQGSKLTGRLEASSESDAEQMLWNQNYTIVELKETRQGPGLQLSLGGVKTRDLIVFSRQLATLIDSGIPIVRAINLLQEQISNRRLANILSEVSTDVQEGRFLSEAFAQHENAFPPMYPQMIEIGEKAGNLQMVLRQVAIYMEKEEDLKGKIRGAMAYPSFVLLMAIGVVFLMLTVALPPLMEMFTAFDAELPLSTRILVALTEFFSVYKFYILAGLLGTVLLVFLLTRADAGRFVFDGLLLKIPLVGRIIIQGAVARMCRSISSLLRAGIALPEIIELVIRTQGNSVIRRALSQVHEELLQGQGFSDPLGKRKNVFPSMLVQMVRVGEETGSMDSNMLTLAEFYEDEVDRSVDALTGALEPAMTIFIGILVGFIAISVITPMYSLMGAIG